MKKNESNKINISIARNTVTAGVIAIKSKNKNVK